MKKCSLEAVKARLISLKARSLVLICSLFIFQSSLVFAAESATFRIQHSISGHGLTPPYGGADDDIRRIEAWSYQGIADQKSFRWFFDNVIDLTTAPISNSEFFYIHNLETGLVLTQNGEDNEVSNWGRIEGDHGQHWSIDNSAGDGSVKIINRRTGHYLTQGFYGTDPNEHVVATFAFDTLVPGGFSWNLQKAEAVDLTRLYIDNIGVKLLSKGTDGATLALTFLIDLFFDVNTSKALSLYNGETWATQVVMTYSEFYALLDDRSEREMLSEFEDDRDSFSNDDVFIDFNGRQIWPPGDEFTLGKHVNDNLTTRYIRGAPVKTVYIYESNLENHKLRIMEYDYASDDDIMGEQYLTPIDWANLSVFNRIQNYGDVAFFDLDVEGSFYTLDLQFSEFRAWDPTGPIAIDVTIEGEEGVASGTVEVLRAALNGFYFNGELVSLRAHPNDLSEFVRWEGVSDGVDLSIGCPTKGECNINVAVDTLIKPIFRQQPRLIINNIFVGNAVTFSPAGTSCAKVPEACQFYPTNTEVTLTATAGSADRVFSHWEGDTDCTDGVVTITDTMSCTPRFTRLSYSLSVTSADLDVTSDNLSEINCGVDCDQDYLVSSGSKTVLLTAQAEAGWTFVGWSGSADCRDEDESDSNVFTARVTVGAKDVSCHVVAYETGTKRSLTVETHGGGLIKAQATPSADSSGLNCDLDVCSQNYPVLTDVQLTATETRGSTFSGFDTLVGSNTFTGNVVDNVCYDGQITMNADVVCIARFNSSVLVVDGSNSTTPKESNEYIAPIQSVGGLDVDIWSVGYPNKTSNPDGRAEPNADDLANYGRVIWYSGDTNIDNGLAAGPSPAAEANLAQYLDTGGCFILSSPEYSRDRASSGLSNFAQTYLGVSDIVADQTETHARSSGLYKLGFSQLESSIGVSPPNPFNFQNSSSDFIAIGSKVDSIVHNPDVVGSEVIFKYRDGGNEAAIAVDNDVYRSVFMGFPFLGLNSGNDQNNVMKGLMDFCALPESDDFLEANDDFSEAFSLTGFLSQKNLKRMPTNDDFFHWTADAFTNATFSIKFSHVVGDLAIGVYDNDQNLVGSSQSTRDIEDVFVADVAAGDSFYVRVFGTNEISVPYVLKVASDGDRDHDGVEDSRDGRPDDPNEQLDTDRDTIGNKADLDDDNDGMPDIYEIENGFDPLASSSALGDEDLDGFTNLDEYKAKTDPNDSNSFPEKNTSSTGSSASGGGGSVNIVFLFLMQLLIIMARRKSLCSKA